MFEYTFKEKVVLCWLWEYLCTAKYNTDILLFCFR